MAHRGTTLPELVAVLVLLGVFALMAGPGVASALDRGAVRRASVEMRVAISSARSRALHHSTRTSLIITPGLLEVRSLDPQPEIVSRRLGPAAHGVSVEVSRSVLRFGPNGLGWGAANTTIRLRRGAAETVLVLSRLGRVRRAR